MKAAARVIRGFLSLLTGMWVTFRRIFKRPVTLTYPHKKPELSAAFRSAISLIRFDESGSHDCVACLQCQNICPSYCIAIEGEKPEGLKKKRATKFDVDYALCSLCGLCIDVCPTVTLEYSKIYDVADYRPDAFVYDLLEPYRDGEADFLVEARKKAEAAALKKAEAAKAAKAAKEAKAAAAAKEEENAAGKTETAKVEG
jgi:NADH-quinone oxidoreductase chain I